MAFSDNSYQIHGGVCRQHNHGITFEEIAHYAGSSNAVISGDVKQGEYLLLGIHFELDADMYAQTIIQSSQHNSLVKEQ